MTYKMNVEETFRNLVTGVFLPELNYSRSKFSFKTVFYQTAYVYRCCECAFEHEYLEYITTSGKIDENKYNKILQNIISGKCPHVEGVSEYYIRETCVRAIHIAAAVGPREAMQSYLHNHEDLLTYRKLNEGTFTLSPFRLAVLKGNIDNVTLLCDSVPKPNNLSSIFSYSNKMKCAYRTELQRPIVEVDEVSPVEFCIRENNRQLLKAMLRTSVKYADINKALEYTVKHNLNDMQADLLEYINDVSDYYILKACSISTIVYDQPNILNKLLQKLSKASGSKMQRDVFILSIYSKVLHRKVCANILKPYTSEDNEDKAAESLRAGIDLLHQNFDGVTEEIWSALKANPQIQEAVNITTAQGTLLHACINPRELYPEKVKFLLDQGINVNSVDQNGKTALFNLLRVRYHYVYSIIPLRTIIEMLLYENPSVDINKMVVESAIKIDERMGHKKALWFDLRGEYVMDNQTHSRISRSSSNCFSVTDYFAPLLIVCGFPVTRDTLVDALDKPLPAGELEYIRQYLQTPRSLMLRCRDVIRGHYKRSQVHKFVEVSDVPKKIKDFILLKSYFVRFD